MRKLADRLGLAFQDLSSDIGSLGQTTKYIDRQTTDARNRLAASEAIQQGNVRDDMVRDLFSGNEGVERTLVDALKGVSTDDLQDLVSKNRVMDATKLVSGYAEKADEPISLRTLYQMGERGIIENPKTAMAVGTGAAGAGGIAAITASGAGLNALANFIAGGQQTQENRDNVLRS